MSYWYKVRGYGQRILDAERRFWARVRGCALLASCRFESYPVHHLIFMSSEISFVTIRAYISTASVNCFFEIHSSAVCAT